MSIETLSWVGGPHGETVNAATSGYDSMAATGGTQTWDTTWTPRGRPSIDGNGTDAAGYVLGVHDIAATDALAYDQPIKMLTLPAAEQGLLFFGNAESRQMSVVSMPDGSVMVRDRGAANAWRSPAGVRQVGVPIVLSVYMTRHATAGTFRVVVYAEDNTTVLADSGLVTGKNTGSLPITRIKSSQVKSGSTSTVVGRSLTGRPRWDRAATGILPAPAPHRPFRIWDAATSQWLDDFHVWDDRDQRWLRLND